MPEARIASVTPLTERIALIALEVAGGAPDWTPGAHVDVETAAGPRSYSLIRWPGDTGEHLQIAVQREDAGQGGSRAMHGLVAGDRLTLSAPANDFALVEDEAPVTLLAGGIGVTPLISMATACRDSGRACDFHYTGRSADLMAFRAEVADRFDATIHTDDAAPIDLATVCDVPGHLYICGPKGMIDAARAAAEAAGVPPDRIHVELFTTATPAAGDQPFEVEVASTGEVLTVAAGQSIIEALEAAGHDVMYDCQRGDCGICQTDVLDGTPDHRDVVLSQAERDAGKVMQICVSRARTPRLKLDL